MKTLEICGKKSTSRILVGESIARIDRYLPGNGTVIITDENVRNYYGAMFPEGEVIVIGTGESIKTLDTVQAIFERLIDLEADRSTFLLGIGGGIVCDVTGFVASTYMRGVRFGYAATTLLAQVDASVGGKNGVNFMGYKNMMGVFNQPEFVVCDPHVLRTLPGAELACGFAEIVKHAAIADKDYFTRLEASAFDALRLDPQILEQIIHDSVVIKADIVNRDELEKGERRKLNFGHTLGHALEKTTGMRHGEAVSVGMVAAAKLSAARKLMAGKDVDRLIDLLHALKLPTAFEMDRSAVIDSLARDKKRQGDDIHFVLLEGIGRAIVESIPMRTLETVLMGG